MDQGELQAARVADTPHELVVRRTGEVLREALVEVLGRVRGVLGPLLGADIRGPVEVGVGGGGAGVSRVGAGDLQGGREEASAEAGRQVSRPHRRRPPAALIIELVRMKAAQRKAKASAAEANKAVRAARKRLADLGIKETT